jgi:hypothetical protein
MDEDQQSHRLAAVDTEGRQRFGDDAWTTMCGSMGRQGVNREVLANIIAAPNAVSTLARIGQEALLLEMQGSERIYTSEYRDLDQAYRALRDAQRQEYHDRQSRR